MKDGDDFEAYFIYHHNRRYMFDIGECYIMVPDRDIDFINEAEGKSNPSPVPAYIKVHKKKAPKMLVNGHWLPGHVKPPKTEPDELMARRRDLRWMYGCATKKQ